MSRCLMRALSAAIVSVALLAGAPALAQDQEPSEEELERARATFMEGVEHTQAERWPEAAAAFRAVMEVRATPQVRFNLGFALAHIESDHAEAATLLASVVDSEELDRRTRRNARNELDRIEPSLGRVVVRLTGDEGGVDVLLDGEPLGLHQIGQPIYARPGSHTAVAQRGGVTLDSRDVEVTAGITADVMLGAATGSVLDPELVEPPPEDDGGGGDVTGEWWFWTAIVGAAALIGAGIVIGVVVASDGSVQPFSGNLDPGTLEVMP